MANTRLTAAIRGETRSTSAQSGARDAGRSPEPARALTPAEQELAHIERARNNPQAFAPLYEAYADLVWRYTLSRLRDPERAADATSQTFSKAIAALPRFRPEQRGDGTTFRSWLMLIARNVVIDEVRKHRPTTPLDTPSAQPWLVDGSRSPEEAAILAEERRRIQTALEQLTRQQRKVVELQTAGMKGAEIAELLEISISAVRTTHFRAYVRLRELLGEPGNDQGTSA